MSQNAIRRIIVSTAKAPGAIGPYNQVDLIRWLSINDIKSLDGQAFTDESLDTWKKSMWRH